MKKEKIYLKNIPAMIWNEASDKVFVAIHGDQSNKEDTATELLAVEAAKKGYQVLSFDLPQHGERKAEVEPDNVPIYLDELTVVMECAQKHWSSVSIYANSMGAYFSLMTYEKYPLRQVLFHSPVVDMRKLIEDLMLKFDVTIEQLEREKAVKTPFKTLYWTYYSYVKTHPIERWTKKTNMLYGDKDDLTSLDTIEKFCKKFNCELTVLKDTEHFFWQEKDLKAYTDWLKKTII